jgi:exosortase/archaeosortase family protein
MATLWKRWTERVPGEFLAALLLGGGFLGFVTWDQAHWWSVKEDYSFGWLVPAFVGFIVHDRWPKILASLAACATPGSPRVRGVAAGVVNFLIYGSLASGALLFLVGALYRAGAGPSYPGTLALSLGAGALLLPLLMLNAPETPAPTPSGWRDDGRVQVLTHFWFPALVWLVSAPMVSVVENNLSLFLLQKVTAVVFFVFDTLGMAIEQQGNVLKLPLGDVGVADACSGIRSLTACLFAGSFLAAVFLDKLWKKILLVVAAMLFAVFTNLLRGLFLTSWAYAYGPAAIEGTVHDVAGYAVLGLTVIGLLCLLPLFNLRFVSADEAERS